MSHKAVFFDRDGTLIVDKHYLKDPNEIEYFKDTFSVLKELQKKNYLLFIVTNQSGISRGFFTVEDMHRIHDKILEDFKSHGINIAEIAFCPHSPEDHCNCRKPKPKLIHDLIEKYSIDKSKSFMVGDKEIDLECGKNAGIKSYKVKSTKDLLNFLDCLDS